MGIHNVSVYENFMNNCNIEIKKLKTLVDTANKNNQQVWIYGASTKGNCLLQYAQLYEKDMKYAVERNPKKIGKMTSTGSEIISEEVMRTNPPEYLLVLPWHFKDEIILRESDYLKNGGHLYNMYQNTEVTGINYY